MFKRMLLCYDGSAGSKRAAEMALRLAAEQECLVYVLSVIEHLPHSAATVGESEEEYERAASYFREGQEELARKAPGLGVRIETQIVVGNAPHTIVQAVEQGEFDLVVLGHSGHSEIWGRFMGTTADKVARHANCSVLIVR